ncbi:glycosyltransferase family 4 protein [Phreatobacter sp. AB_2022a]|uniref:glycosyltransferase family 4 protein n=1 Tax=Phreatobacter sp. AB_2022a TaxID=3003134 RepID=UPI002287556D|nr:glycosyltransferase family 4 protein [Phreatobacter sp. AB_2022a]MCZ0736774.1 glycosyltransferase family 4 protein [Phreatobacter sp. AB_2022a]
MTAAAFAIPGDLSSPTGGYRYDREVLARAAAHGVALRHLALPAAFPFPDAGALATAGDALARLGADTVLLADGLAFGAFPESLLAAIRSPIVALVHHPLALESGLEPALAARLKASETAALARAEAVIVTSRTTAAILAADYAVAPARLHVAEPGTAHASRAVGSPGPGVSLLAVGAVSARKGYDRLVAALAPLEALDWHLTIAGATDRAPSATAALRAAITEAGLGQRIRLAGPVDEGELAALYAGADLFVLASLFEGYGMVLTEAMAHGLAIVTTTGGAAAETVPDDAALKVAPGAVGPLSEALGAALADAGLRRRLGDAAFAAAGRLPGWDDTTRIICDVVIRIASRTIGP